MSSHYPDDWHAHWLECDLCGARYHASEAYCDCEDRDLQLDECERCGQRYLGAFENCGCEDAQ